MVSPSPDPLIAVALGDPCGIGPEVALRALADPTTVADTRFVLIGSGAVLREVAGRFGLDDVSWRALGDGEDPRRADGTTLIDIADVPASLAASGRETAEGGRCAGLAVERAARLALDGRVDAIVTAPLNKVALKRGGFDWPGHTEMLAALCGAPKPVMMMVGGGLRAALVTTHVAVSDLPRHITRDNVLATIRIVDHDLRRRFGVASPRIGVAGLNPHAGEGGRFGLKEQTDILPAIEAARAEGVDCEGPFPADVIFTPAKRERFDAVVAMYHDQANIPVKMLAFESGVNVTLGLPIIRTSPDHGTAFDIAPRGVADPGSMKAAVVMARDMVLASGAAT